MIHPETPIRLIDTHTKRVLSTSTYRNVKRMRTRADRMDNAHGGYRYVVQVDYDFARAMDAAQRALRAS